MRCELNAAVAVTDQLCILADKSEGGASRSSKGAAAKQATAARSPRGDSGKSARNAAQQGKAPGFRLGKNEVKQRVVTSAHTRRVTSGSPKSTDPAFGREASLLCVGEMRRQTDAL